MKQWFIYIALFLCGCLSARASVHPRIYVSDADKEAVRDKIAHTAWGKEAFQKLKDKIDPYVERHRNDPEWIVSRLAMYWKEGEHYTQCYLKDQNWDRGEGNAPVPTVRMPGMRTWNKYSNVPLEERIPYNETGDMWGINRADPSSPKVLVPYKESGHMIRGNNIEILTLAEEASFMYWATGDEAYACFAADIFNAWLLGTYYMNPILDPGRSTGGAGGYEPGGICGYYDYEQIHDDLAMHAVVVYDFLFDYLLAHPHPHLKESGMDLPEMAGVVFKRFIDIGFVRGSKTGNWNVNGWNIMLRPILALEENEAYADGKGRPYYLHYLTTESTRYHDAIPDILKSYDPVTGLWPESPGYSFGTVSTLLDFAMLLNRCGIDVMADNPVLQKAALAVFPWMDDRANMIVFGDSRGGRVDFGNFERLLSYYISKEDTVNVSRVASVLQLGVENGYYRREDTDWKGLCLYTGNIPKVNNANIREERMSYSPHHRLITMKSQKDEENLMAVLYGGRKGFHLSPNGLALQLYGFGYALAPDAAGYESYWSADYRYHQSAAGSNTILPGYAEGNITVRLMEPGIDTIADFVNTQSLNPYINVCDVEAGEKRRVVAMVKTASDKGYYVDIFRSDLPDNDYLFHNVGKSLHLADFSGLEIETEDVDSIPLWRHAGYAWFKNPRRAVSDAGFKATWNVASGQTDLSMQMWMLGAEGREIFCVDAPYTTLLGGLTPGNASAAPLSTPALIVRQTGNNAWNSPFIAVVEPVKNGKASVVGIGQLGKKFQNVSGIRIDLSDGQKDYIVSSMDLHPKRLSVQGLSVKGAFGLVSEKDKRVTQLYLLNGTELKKDNVSLKSIAPVSVSVFQREGQWYYSSTGNVRIVIDGKEFIVNRGFQKLLIE